MKALALSVCAVVLVSAVASSYPTFLGPTGLTNVPAPGVMEAGSYNVFFNSILADGNVIFYGANLGAGKAFGKKPMELGVTEAKPEGGAAETLFNFKWGFKAGLIDIAIGYIGGYGEKDPSLYLVAGKVSNRNSAPKGGIPPIYGTLGVATSGEGGMDGIFAGLSSTLPTGLNVHLEYDTEDVNLGVNYPLSEAINLRADLVSDEVGFGASYAPPLKY